ncbi:site-specific DNA-methyltransferase [Micrococcus sp. TA1]|uniref:DNA-methyltransferase n=1 Tax=Micrococcus sp. TA1 TaxID=681627 RepID=UPI001614298E|nr:site-specific DNA-methyltransferase [Micrococcus sp. TA1]MBB5748552.1 site-specific DNA-methyltransferase (adenine-specific) [Micrococcus sp. TA1]
MKPYYQDESVTLYNGDCQELADKWTSADVLVTDPPYGVEWTGHNSSYRTDGERVTTTHKAISGDHDAAARDAVLAQWGNRPAIVFGSWRVARPDRTEHRLIWHKQGQAPGPLKAAFMSQDEEIYVIGKGFRKSSPPLRSVITTTEARSVEVAKIGHPTPKPVGLMEVLIDRCPPGTIADPFAGSGATLIAARNLGRKSVGIELEERYCELIASRLSQTAFDLGALA